jgi:hypothetical protein
MKKYYKGKFWDCGITGIPELGLCCQDRISLRLKLGILVLSSDMTLKEPA